MKRIRAALVAPVLVVFAIPVILAIVPLVLTARVLLVLGLFLAGVAIYRKLYW